MKLLKWLFGKLALNKSSVSSSLPKINTRFGVNNPIANSINTGGIGHEALQTYKEPIVVGYEAGFIKNGEHTVIGYIALNQDSNSNDC